MTSSKLPISKGHRLACSRFSDSGEDTKVKGTLPLPSFLPFYFHVRAFSIPRTRLSLSLEQASHSQALEVCCIMLVRSHAFKIKICEINLISIVSKDKMLWERTFGSRCILYECEVFLCVLGLCE